MTKNGNFLIRFFVCFPLFAIQSEQFRNINHRKWTETKWKYPPSGLERVSALDCVHRSVPFAWWNPRNGISFVHPTDWPTDWLTRIHEHFQIKHLFYFSSLSLLLDISDIPDDIKHLQSLQVADFSSNPIPRLPAGFSQLKSLTVLGLNDMSLTSLPEDFGR